MSVTKPPSLTNIVPHVEYRMRGTLFHRNAAATSGKKEKLVGGRRNETTVLSRSLRTYVNIHIHNNFVASPGNSFSILCMYAYAEQQTMHKREQFWKGQELIDRLKHPFQRHGFAAARAAKPVHALRSSVS